MDTSEETPESGRVSDEADLDAFRDRLKQRYGIAFEEPMPDHLIDLIQRLSALRSKRDD